MSFRPSLRAVWLPAALGLMLAPGAAQAQFLERLSLSAHLGGGTILSAPQSDEFGFGGALELRAGVRLAGPLRLHLLYSAAVWPVKVDNASESVGSTSAIGGGLRVDPQLSASLGGFFIDADAAYNATGADAAGRFGYTLGAGWLFPITGILHLGPALRFGQVVGSDSDEAAGRGTATYWRAGLEITLRAPAEAPAPPPAPPEPPRPVDPDHDGVVGMEDQCPQQPETRNGFQDEDGCPDEPDPDHDNISGIADQCPSQPETLNGFQDDDGCPDTVPLAEPPPATAAPAAETPVAPAAPAVTVSQVLTYEARRDRVEREMRATLDEVASFLAAHPEVRVRIEGHADDNGNPNRDARLARKRAQNVQRYLTRAHVARDRLTVEGVGAARPCTGGSNRCVDFIVLENAAAPAAGAPAAPAADAPAAPAAEAPAEAGGHHGRRGRHGRRRH